MANFLWRRRQNRTRTPKNEPSKPVDEIELSIPTHFRCPISLDLMKDPVSLSTGITYDRESIEKWFDSGNSTCPLTNQPLETLDQIPNHAIRIMIQEWCVENKSLGVKRILTPRVPITPHEASVIRSKISEAAMIGDESKCLVLVRKVESLAKENERNKLCLVSSGIGSAFAVVVESFPIEKHEVLLREVLSALVWSFPLCKEGVLKLESAVSLRCMAWFLSARSRDAVLFLREMITGCASSLAEVEGVAEALIHLVKTPICSKTTSSCLVIMNQMMRKAPAITLRFVELGLVPLVLDVLVDGNKSCCEKGLAVLDVICESREGKESVCLNALTVPVVVKKVLRVSEVGTGFAVEILWRVVVGGRVSEAVEAVRVGGFQKLLVVLQVGCGERTKEKVNELLKVMNMWRHKLDCFDSYNSGLGS